MSTTSTTIADPHTEALAARAAAIAPALAATTPSERARALVAAADALMAAAGELVPIAMSETGLTEARLKTELNRTAVQLRLFADTVLAGDYLGVRVDAADPEFVLGPRPDLRRMLVPLGPILNYSASNFPFAFSVAGGDTAAALAAGCPVIVKVHTGHPKLSQATADVVSAALVKAGLPDGTLQLVFGREPGIALLKDPRIRAGSFTGSTNGGRILADIAAARPDPIPFFGELGSVNPVFVTEAAAAEAGTDIAKGYVTSVAGSAGQLCTKPGFLFLPAGHSLDATIAQAAEAVTEHRLLNPAIASGYQARRQAVIAAPGVRTIAPGELRIDGDGQGWATPTIVAISLSDLRRAGEAVLDETFGPLSVVVEYPKDAGLAGLISELFPGNLTVTIYAATGEDSPTLRQLVAAAAQHAGRVLFGGWPTGVAVTPAMQHGGPWPATTNDCSTSVGTAAIGRFLRPVTYQGAPDSLLPSALREANPWRVPRTINASGESKNWGAGARQ